MLMNDLLRTRLITDDPETFYTMTACLSLQRLLKSDFSEWSLNFRWPNPSQSVICLCLGPRHRISSKPCQHVVSFYPIEPRVVQFNLY